MKIGIITFHRAHNFGAQMQMYALYNYLIQLNHDVQILDYYCPAVEDIYKKRFRNFRAYINRSLFTGLFKFLKDICGNILYQKDKIDAFNSFLNDNFKLTNRFYSANEIPTDFDVLITGSDQVWGYSIIKEYKEPFFLDFTKNDADNPIRISYAASAERESYPLLKDDAEYIHAVLSKFKIVSVREKNLSDLLWEAVGITSKVVLDPTFLLTRKDYLEIAVKPKEQNYLCVYQVTPSKNLLVVANKVAKERNLKIISIKANLIANSKSDAWGPKEILGLLCYADVIVTSSFHGTAFSIINRKDFYSVYDGPSYRVQNLLSLFNLNDRYITKIEDYDNFESVCYSEVLIENEILESKSLLQIINEE